jgi:apolipoprotein N-acyltransferase
VREAGPGAKPIGPGGRQAPWIALALAAAALPFSIGNLLVPAAGWLAPLFMLAFTRSARRRWLPAGALACAAAHMLAWRGVLPFSGPVYFAVTGAVGLAFFLPYAIDRLAPPSCTGWRRALVFPCAFVVVETAFSEAGFGTWGLLGYSQAGALPLLQLLAVTGLPGLTFLICWAAALAAGFWCEGGSRSLRLAAAAFAGLLMAILLVGGMRIAARDAGPTVRVAGVVVDNLEVFRGAWGPLTYGRPLTERQAALAAGGVRRLQDALMQRTREAARAGARIVVWSEANALTFSAQEPALVAEARRLAADEAIYLFLSVAVMTPGEPRAVNKLIVIDPSGAVRGSYLKSHPTPGEMSVPGDGRVGVLDTPHGRLAWAICYDFDYPGLIRQASRAGADILIDPSWEHSGMDPLHSQMASYRAIENGAALFRPVNGGLSLAVDGKGRVLAATRSGDMTADLPTAGHAAAYPWLGNALAWASLGLLILMGQALRGGRAGSRRS